METQIVHDVEKQQFQLPITGTDEIAFVNYKMREGIMYLVHSEVPYTRRGGGIGRKLVLETKKYLDDRKIEAIPTCGYIRYIYGQLERNNSVIDDDAEE